MNKDIFRKESFLNFFSSVLAIVVGLLIGFIVLLVSNPQDAVKGFATILLGGFNNGIRGLGQVFYTASPIILTGLSVGFAFKTGLFNIGAPGQLIVGAYSALFVAHKFTFLPEGMVVYVAVTAAFIAGGLWAFVPGFLKTYLNVSEVISTIMMNYIGMYTVNYLVTQTIFDKLRNQSITPPTYALISKMGLDKLFPGTSINGGIIIAVAAVIIVYIVLTKTTFGYGLIACGFNKDASKYAGINVGRNIILSMCISGAIAGLAGAVMFLAGTGKHIEVVDVLVNEGFMGIPVALLGISNPIGILLSGIFIAHLTLGGFYLQGLNFAPEVIDIIISLIIYFTAFSLIMKKIASRILRIKKGDS